MRLIDFYARDTTLMMIMNNIERDGIKRNIRMGLKKQQDEFQFVVAGLGEYYIE